MNANNQNNGSGKSLGDQVAEKAALGAASAVGGAVALGILGFFLGGPPGAAIGAKLVLCSAGVLALAVRAAAWPKD